MKPINQALFNALQKKFGKVGITNLGVEAKYRVIDDRISTWVQAAKGVPQEATTKRVNWMNWGETYAVNCPKCNDKRHRLYIGHLWGTHCEAANRKLTSCIKCHNESCYWGDLWDVLYGNADCGITTQKAESMRTGIDSDTRKMELPGNVEDLVPINQLDRNHPVIQYLLSRNFTDIEMLATEYQFCYCLKSPWKKRFTDSAGNWHVVSPENRLIIPNVQQGTWQGWMARYIGDIPKDPNTNKPVIQKYLNAPGYSFGASVYRLEDAHKFTNGRFAIVCEGALSAIACGPAGVATFGMYPKPMQEELLADRFKNGQIIFLIEAEASSNGRIFDCIDRLNTKIAGGCISVPLPKGEDPATMSASDLIQLIKQKSHVKP